MSKKQDFLTHMFANCSMTLLSLATMLGLGFSSIKLFTFMNHNIALITNVNWTNALILNCILDGVMMLVFSVGLIIQLIDGNCEEQIQAILKIVSILSIAIFMISSYFSCSSFGDSMTLLYNLLISCLGVAFGIAAIASIGLAFMHKKVINKISYWKNRLSNFLQAKKEKQEKNFTFTEIIFIFLKMKKRKDREDQRKKVFIYISSSSSLRNTH